MTVPSTTHLNIYTHPAERVTAHDGVGQISFARLLTRDQVDGPCNFMDYTIMPPGTTIGAHRHGMDQEEYYLILQGQGEMSLEDRCFAVGPGDLVRNPPGGRHGLVNTGDEPLHLFVVELAVGL